MLGSWNTKRAIEEISNTNATEIDAASAEQSSKRFCSQQQGQIQIIEAKNPLELAMQLGFAENPHQQLLKYLIDEKKWDLLEKYSQNGLKLNEKDMNGRTLLHYACKNGEEDTIKALISLGANLNIKDENGITGLHLASQKGFTHIVTRLLRNEVLLNEQDDKGRAALELAMQNSHHEIAMALIEKGANLDALKKNAFEWLYRCLEEKKYELFEALCSHGVDVNVTDSIGSPLIHRLVKKSRYFDENIQEFQTQLSLLLKYGANLSAKDKAGSTPLHVVTHPIVAKQLIESGALLDIKDSDGLTPLVKMVKEKRQDVVEMMLEKGANPFESVTLEYTHLNLMDFAKTNNRHIPFSKWLKSRMTLGKDKLEQIENAFFILFERVFHHARLQNKKVLILLGEQHAGYHGYQIEKAALKAAQRAGGTHFMVEQRHADLPKYCKVSDTYNYAKKHLKLEIVGIDNYRVEDMKFNCTAQGVARRDIGMRDSIQWCEKDAIALVGAGHLEGLVDRSWTRIDRSKYFVVPFNLQRVEIRTFAFGYQHDSKDVIQVGKAGFDLSCAYKSISLINGVDLTLDDVSRPTPMSILKPPS